MTLTPFRKGEYLIPKDCRDELGKAESSQLRRVLSQDVKFVVYLGTVFRDFPSTSEELVICQKYL